MRRIGLDSYGDTWEVEVVEGELIDTTEVSVKFTQAGEHVAHLQFTVEALSDLITTLIAAKYEMTKEEA